MARHGFVWFFQKHLGTWSIYKPFCAESSRVLAQNSAELPSFFRCSAIRADRQDWYCLRELFFEFIVCFFTAISCLSEVLYSSVGFLEMNFGRSFFISWISCFWCIFCWSVQQRSLLSLIDLLLNCFEACTNGCCRQMKYWESEMWLSGTRLLYLALSSVKMEWLKWRKL